MVTRIVVTLNGDERAGLHMLAERELRDIRDQLRVILRRELERQGIDLKPLGDELRETRSEIDFKPDFVVPRHDTL